MGSSFAYVLLPKPPPTSGTTTRMRPSGASNILASSTRTENGFCVEAHTVRLSASSQAATAACGSMATCWTRGKVKVSSTTTSAPASAASASPRA